MVFSVSGGFDDDEVVDLDDGDDTSTPIPDMDDDEIEGFGDEDDDS